ncbi:CP2J2 protein, partial [Cercotrichas coryphoeus]|nr:CP2J2 protein [Cercotrichas coryphoeus]
YSSAVLSEVLRMGNVVPLGVPRMATSDTTLAGFHLPKVQKLPQPVHGGGARSGLLRVICAPFAGKRACPGEQLARTELFIFFVALLQKF